jgi:hypothetical protein
MITDVLAHAASPAGCLLLRCWRAHCGVHSAGFVSKFKGNTIINEFENNWLDLLCAGCLLSALLARALEFTLLNL